MAFKINASGGSVEVSEDVVVRRVKRTVAACDGIVEWAAPRSLKDGLSQFFGRENAGRGVDVHMDQDGITVDVHVVVGYGTRIGEAARQVQQQVSRALIDSLDITVKNINVYVQGVRTTERP